jgi:CRISPR-associated endonuclease Csn1
MNEYIQKEISEPVTNDMVWAFDLGKGSVGEAVRRGNEFLHKASLLIPAEFAETKTAAGRRRMFRTREAHKARERWLNEVMRDAGIQKCCEIKNQLAGVEH